MLRTYQYKDFTIEVTVQSDFSGALKDERALATYVVVVTIARTGAQVAIFSPLRLGDSSGRSFSTEGEALMTGYSAAGRIVDDLLGAEAPR
ncbi:hypothetical protein SAMN05446635_5359 [Burkholderia sp. OK233]|nr:hypothetical protein SAMN05446635_5359 [Burkholderia sp. OK233]